MSSFIDSLALPTRRLGKGLQDRCESSRSPVEFPLSSPSVGGEAAADPVCLGEGRHAGHAAHRGARLLLLAVAGQRGVARHLAQGVGLLHTRDTLHYFNHQIAADYRAQ